METIKALTIETIQTSQTIYEFEDLFATVGSELIILEGFIELETNKVGDYIAHPQGFEPTPTYELKNIRIEITKSWDVESEERLLSKAEHDLIISEITELLKVLPIENN